MGKKVAVVMFNLGGPDSKEAIRPFLMNFFMDRNIINLPFPLRWVFARLISNRRSRREAGDSYGALGGKSPLLDNTRAQAKVLEKFLNDTSYRRKPGSSGSIQRDDGDVDFKTFVCMRYWHPMAEKVVREVRSWDADQIILLPLYPQFSTTTSWSSLGVWKKAADIADYERPTSMLCCYPENEGFIQASAENVKEKYEQALAEGHENPRILFSAHGLPEDIIKGGDPYQWQCETSAEAIVKRLHVILKGLGPEGSKAVGKKEDPSAQALQDDKSEIDWKICYQSRVGPKKWIGPSLEKELERAAKDGKAVVIYPHAFTQEHVETLVELDIEYHEIAEGLGIKGYYRAATVSEHPAFIDGLAGLVQDHLGKIGIEAESGGRICPDEFTRCCMRAGVI